MGKAPPPPLCPPASPLSPIPLFLSLHPATQIPFSLCSLSPQKSSVRSIPPSLRRSSAAASLSPSAAASSPARNGWVKRVTSCRKRVNHRSVSTFLIFFFCADVCQKNTEKGRDMKACVRSLASGRHFLGHGGKMHIEKCDRAATRLISLTALTLGNSCCARAQKKNLLIHLRVHYRSSV